MKTCNNIAYWIKIRSRYLNSEQINKLWWQLTFDKQNRSVVVLAITAHRFLTEHVAIGNFHFADSLFANEYLEDPILINLMAQKADGRGRYSVEAWLWLVPLCNDFLSVKKTNMFQHSSSQGDYLQIHPPLRGKAALLPVSNNRRSAASSGVLLARHLASAQTTCNSNSALASRPWEMGRAFVFREHLGCWVTEREKLPLLATKECWSS